MKGSRSRGNLLPSLSGGGSSLNNKKEEAIASSKAIGLSPLHVSNKLRSNDKDEFMSQNTGLHNGAPEVNEITALMGN